MCRTWPRIKPTTRTSRFGVSVVLESAEKVASATSAAADGALHGEEKLSGVDYTLCKLWRVASESSKLPGTALVVFLFQHGFRHPSDCVPLDHCDLLRAWQRELPAVMRNSKCSSPHQHGSPAKYHCGQHDHRCTGGTDELVRCATKKPVL